MDNKERLRSVAAKNQPEDAWSPDLEIMAFRQELEHLYTQVQTWLKDLIDDGAVTVSEIRQPVYEELLGSYEVPALLITIGRDTVKFKPSGTMYFGCKGSLTVEGPYGDIELSRVTPDRVEGMALHSADAAEWVWCIETQSDNKPVFNRMDEDLFTEALLNIVEARGGRSGTVECISFHAERGNEVHTSTHHCALTNSLSASSIRVCQPLPVARK